MKHHITAAKLAHLSYGKKKHRAFHWTSNLSNYEEDIEAFSFDLDDYRFITIRGSSSVKDWVRNLQTDLYVTPYEEEGYQGLALIHSGFYFGYQSIQKNILKLAETNRKIVVSGHSLGGAIATIAAVDINYKLDKRVEAVTFGSPGVGNASWHFSATKRIESTGYRNRFDIVPSLLRTYHHGTNQVLLPQINYSPHHTKNYHKNVKQYVLQKK